MGTLTWKLVAPAVTEPTTFTESFQLVHADATWFGPVQTLTINVTPGTGGGGDDDGSGGHGGCSTTGGGGWLAAVAALGLVARRRSR